MDAAIAVRSSATSQFVVIFSRRLRGIFSETSQCVVRGIALEAIGSERRLTVVRITVELVEVTRQGRREGTRCRSDLIPLCRGTARSVPLAPRNLESRSAT
jgi:hypothetical protein